MVYDEKICFPSATGPCGYCNCSGLLVCERGTIAAKDVPWGKKIDIR